MDAFTAKIYVADYLNYRIYLREAFAWLKKNSQQFSQKLVQMELGVASTGFLSNVIAGRKNLSAGQALRLAKLLELTTEESIYFETLVLYTQARIANEKSEFFNRLVQMQSNRLKQISADSLTLFSKWYYVVVREYLGVHQFSGCADTLASKLNPCITEREAQDALDALKTIGLIEQDALGYWIPCDRALSTGDELISHDLAQFQVATMGLAQRAVMEIPLEERDISVLTMGLSLEGFQQVKREIQIFRKRLVKIAVEDIHALRVYQVNFQLFPVTQEDGAL